MKFEEFYKQYSETKTRIAEIKARVAESRNKMPSESKDSQVEIIKSIQLQPNSEKVVGLFILLSKIDVWIKGLFQYLKITAILAVPSVIELILSLF